ncbi:hypothetical protein L6164_025545 [Bauhinia variegata]|uniref:Uncharacterized protein n=1 Tax=Bauhinia variegata TaxID=167791 RepID=A0ACB9M2M6_BAUVA|nr:hypothetical protein L6164_025545 [Bauhinia variegata]
MGNPNIRQKSKSREISINRRKRGVGFSNSANKVGEEWPFPSDSSFEFEELPSDIAIDILSRLIIMNFFNCRCVCKGWLRLNSTPRFVELQLARSLNDILLKTMPDSRQSWQINVIDVEEHENAP